MKIAKSKIAPTKIFGRESAAPDRFTFLILLNLNLSKIMKTKIICLLQNSWGDRTLPSIFKPNELNHSARVIRKIVGSQHQIYFCNTTRVTTSRANDREKIDEDHMRSLIPRLKRYDVILICGLQAKTAFQQYRAEFGDNVIYMPHPASRTFGNDHRKDVSYLITHKLRSNE